MSVSHTGEGHVHASQGHQTSSEHREQSEVEQENAKDEGIWQAVAIFSPAAAVRSVTDGHGFQSPTTGGDASVARTDTKPHTRTAG